MFSSLSLKYSFLKCFPSSVSQQTLSYSIVTCWIQNKAWRTLALKKYGNCQDGWYFIKILTSSFLFIWYVDLFTLAQDELNINITWLIYSLLSIKIFYKHCSAKHKYSTPWILPNKSSSLTFLQKIISLKTLWANVGLLSDSLPLIAPISLSKSKQKYPLTVQF